MFVGISKTLAKFGGVRFGVGLRITKNNAIWMSFVVMFVSLMQAVWYMMIISFWLMYAICCGLFLGIKKLIQTIVTVVKNKKEGNQA